MKQKQSNFIIQILLASILFGVLTSIHVSEEPQHVLIHKELVPVVYQQIPSFNFTYFFQMGQNLVADFLLQIFDITDQGSIIMIMYNWLPVVGSNSLPNSFWVLLAASLGCFVAYWRGWI